MISSSSSGSPALANPFPRSIAGRSANLSLGLSAVPKSSTSSTSATSPGLVPKSSSLSAAAVPAPSGSDSLDSLLFAKNVQISSSASSKPSTSHSPAITSRSPPHSSLVSPSLDSSGSFNLNLGQAHNSSYSPSAFSPPSATSTGSSSAADAESFGPVSGRRRRAAPLASEDGGAGDSSPRLTSATSPLAPHSSSGATAGLFPCPECGRSFKRSALEVHQRVCAQVFAKSSEDKEKEKDGKSPEKDMKSSDNKGGNTNTNTSSSGSSSTDNSWRSESSKFREQLRKAKNKGKKNEDDHQNVNGANDTTGEDSQSPDGLVLNQSDDQSAVEFDRSGDDSLTILNGAGAGSSSVPAARAPHIAQTLDANAIRNRRFSQLNQPMMRKSNEEY